ncbi:flavin-containing monooxygenase [Sphaerisporangium perillae]|uniref:flavin-containing monooxygenase n=1 Tax=Sphaerisporangium perillae TaxID=2935860 RepID=UPI00200C39CD|nr:NAD(P)/FAD-dependent oxidoreductase [Sphaerisporangium perillae]
MAAAGPGITIIGSGFAGLCMAIKLKEAGYHDFVILEKAADLGGTWRENTYPGCACDVPSPMYSFSFDLNPDWSHLFAPREEIWEYMRACAAKYGLTPHLRFGKEVCGLEYQDGEHRWRVNTEDGETFTTNAVVAGIGGLHIPSLPEIPGREAFAGRSFHSAGWDHSYDLTGKRVAVIGTGASAIQFIPKIAPKVERLHVFQRTAPWIQPKPDISLSARTRRTLRALPLARRALRDAVYWLLETRALGFTVDPRLMKAHQIVAERHLAAQVPDPALRARLTPDYTIGCKRILLSDDYYPTLCRDNVELVTDHITEIRPHSIVDATGREHPVDVIIYGTGFKVTEALAEQRIVGRNGMKLQEAWRDGIQAYLGTVTAGFPNLFFLLGPNTGLGHNSVVFMIEAQVRYIMSCLRLLSTTRARALDVLPSAERAYNDRLQRRLSRLVWSEGGCVSWYLDDQGRNRTLWPGFTFEFWARTRTAKPTAYELIP